MLCCEFGGDLGCGWPTGVGHEAILGCQWWFRPHGSVLVESLSMGSVVEMLELGVALCCAGGARFGYGRRPVRRWRKGALVVCAYVITGGLVGSSCRSM